MFDMKQKIIDRANTNLRIKYPEKYTPITFEDIEKVYARNVLGINADTKTRKGNAKGYLTGIMYFAPAKLSGLDVCPMASQGCKAACLFSAGRGRFYTITRARLIKTLAWHFDKARFTATIKKSIASLLVKARNKGMVPVVRLNGTSDILWERVTDILETFPNVQFYDYTKIAKRFLFDIPKNYHLTFSLSETNDTDASFVLAKGGNVAAVFRSELPAKLWGYTVTNGDETDLRFLDKRGVVVGLKAKGRAKQDSSGFVRDIKALKKNVA